MSKQTRLNFSRSATAAPAKKRRRLSTGEDENGEPNEASNKSLKPQASTSAGKSSATATSRQINSTSNKKATTKQTRDQSENTSESSEPRRNPIPAKNDRSAPMDSQVTSNHLKVTFSRTSLFASPPSTVICHATNAQGTWGAGIAAAFKQHYPKAFTLYAAHCKKWPSSTLLGTTLLIPPQTSSSNKSEREAKHWIGCLFTSEKKGKGKGTKESILEATADAVGDLARKVGAEENVAGVRMCKINSGLFGVEWEASKAVIEGIEIEEEAEGSVVREIMVCSLD